MNNTLLVSLVANGTGLSISADEYPLTIRIMDMQGNVLVGPLDYYHKQKPIDIQSLPVATYIIEAHCHQNKTHRTVFVKI
jgi:hypothetical protein